MRITLNRVTKGRGPTRLLPVVCDIEIGKVTVIPVDTADGPSVVSLMAAGRMRPSKGQVLLDGKKRPKKLREVTALVDTPSVCEPHPNLFVHTVVSEELMFAAESAGPISTRWWLNEHEMSRYATSQIGQIPGNLRVRILTELAVTRPDVRFVILTSPDRHGVDMRKLADYTTELAERGYGVAVVCGQTPAYLLTRALEERDVHLLPVAPWEAVPGTFGTPEPEPESPRKRDAPAETPSGSATPSAPTATSPASSSDSTEPAHPAHPRGRHAKTENANSPTAETASDPDDPLDFLNRPLKTRSESAADAAATGATAHPATEPITLNAPTESSS